MLGGFLEDGVPAGGGKTINEGQYGIGVAYNNLLSLPEGSILYDLHGHPAFLEWRTEMKKDEFGRDVEVGKFNNNTYTGGKADRTANKALAKFRSGNQPSIVLGYTSPILTKKLETKAQNNPNQRIQAPAENLTKQITFYNDKNESIKTYQYNVFRSVARSVREHNPDEAQESD